VKLLPLAIDGAWEITPVQHGDARGLFMEWFRADRFAEMTGHPFRLAQTNLSVSAAGVVRGIHYADVPPGQSKYVTCVRGAVFDAIVDLRVGSPTFGRWVGVRLDDVERRAVYLAEGLGHAFCALTDGATLTYLCSEQYNPRAEHSIHPLDPDLAIDWPVASPTLSDRDDAAPSLAQRIAEGRLPDHDTCRAYVDGLRRAAPNRQGHRP
jgi:dTDP-4-dehydrorhamnose 3,5-epimerase